MPGKIVVVADTSMFGVSVGVVEQQAIDLGVVDHAHDGHAHVGALHVRERIEPEDEHGQQKAHRAKQRLLLFYKKNRSTFHIYFDYYR